MTLTEMHICRLWSNANSNGNWFCLYYTLSEIEYAFLVRDSADEEALMLYSSTALLALNKALFQTDLDSEAA